MHGPVLLGDVRWHHWCWWDLWEESRVAPPRSPARSVAAAAAAAIVHKEFSYVSSGQPGFSIYRSRRCCSNLQRTKGRALSLGAALALYCKHRPLGPYRGEYFSHLAPVGVNIFPTNLQYLGCSCPQQICLSGMFLDPAGGKYFSGKSAYLGHS